MQRATFATILFFSAAFTAAAAGVDRAGMDTSVAPGDDFWEYANGGWVKTHPIPPDRSSYGTGAILSEEAGKRTVDLIQAAAKGAAPGSDAQKVGDYYASYMDEAAIEAKGAAPLAPVLARVAAIADRAGLTRVLGENMRADVDAFNATDLYTDNIFGLWAQPAFDAPDVYAPYLIQGGLGMPDRAYYLENDASSMRARANYVSHMAAVLKLAGIADAETKAVRIMALETKIARAHASREDSDDVQKGNNPWTRADFAAKAPGMDWNAYFAAAGLGAPKRFVVWQPSAAIGISKLVASEPIDVWKDYLTLRTIEHYANYLPKAFTTENFAFYGTVLSGTPQIPDRWKRAVSATNAVLGEVVGKLYVAKYFPPQAKAEVEGMVTNIVEAFRKRIEALDWMAASTKAEAIRKLESLKVGIGYPDKWTDYSAYQVVRGDAFGNIQRAEAFAMAREVAKLGQPVDRSEWVMTPQTVNAVNLPVLNGLNFPAAILQAPYFDPKATAAMNYGSIGSVIGHEISHSFDDQGSQFDASGHLRDWWTPADLKRFQAAGTALAAQFDGYKPFPDLAVNGRQTLGENIADLAGLAATYDAYRASLGGKPAPVVDGFSGDQQFFLSFAQGWRTYYRPETLRQRLIGDGHAPAKYRGETVRNMDAWYDAFPVKPADKLYLAPDQRVKVW